MNDMPSDSKDWMKHGPSRLLLELKQKAELEIYKNTGDPDDVGGMTAQGVDCTRNFNRFYEEFRVKNGIDPSTLTKERARTLYGVNEDNKEALLPNPQQQKLVLLDKIIK